MAGQTIGVSSSQSTNAGANQSTVTVTMTLYSNNWSFDGYTTYWGIRIGDAWYSDVWIRTLYSPNSASVTISRTYNHDANGYRGDVTCEAYFDGTGPYMPDYLSAGGPTQGAIDYDRRPGSPGFVTPTVNSNKTISVSVGGVSSPAGTATYHVQWSQNGGAWQGEQTSTGTSFTFSGLLPGQNYQFRAWATNSDGTGGTTYSGVVFLPSGGKRFDGSSFVTTQLARRYTGTGWTDLSIARRYNGANWVDLS
jgi:hypothetical protein